jgi:hypothetical protein
MTPTVWPSRVPTLSPTLKPTLDLSLAPTLKAASDRWLIINLKNDVSSLDYFAEIRIRFHLAYVLGFYPDLDATYGYQSLLNYYLLGCVATRRLPLDPSLG